MKKIISLSIILFFLAFFLGCGENPKPQLTEQIKTGLRADANKFMGSLKAILVKEMQTKGIIAAVSVCSDTAQILTNNYGTNKGIYIKRVSLKNRNANNASDEFETKILKYFEELKAKDNLTETTEYFEIVESYGITVVRYLKPIVLQAPCLSCHGAIENISAEVKTILKKNYPDDKATGYQIDDLRGAISIQKTL